MGFLNFDNDGRIVLTQVAREEKDEEERSVVLKKFQVSDKSPAIAQLIISMGVKVADSNRIMFLLRDICEKYQKYKQSSSETKMTFSDRKIIVEARGSWDMYSYLQELMMNIKSNQELRVVVRGSWTR